MNWKWRPKGANGHASDCNNDCKPKPTATAGFPPRSRRRPVHRRTRALQLRTAVGVVELQVLHGQDPLDKHWGCPVREHWGLAAHQQLSLALADRLAFTITATASYEEAAALAQKWGSPGTDSALHGLAQRLGARAEAQTQAQLQAPPVELQPQRAPTPLAVLMLDGWQVRQRGSGWGKRQTQETRVEWHEWKTGVFYRHEQAGRTAGGRGVLAEKTVIGWQGDPVEFGRRLHWEALRGGLGRAQARLVVADGAPWIWNVARDRWAGATEVLDFYHASQHLWALGRALCGEDEAAAAQWVEPRRHQLRHGREQQVLAELAALPVPPGAAGAVVRREQHCFATHTRRLNYRRIHRRGWPIGSGSVASACRQRQCRFKRPGQFWTAQGMRHRSALSEARHNHHWEELWPTHYSGAVPGCARNRHLEIVQPMPHARFMRLFPATRAINAPIMNKTMPAPARIHNPITG